MNAQALFLWKEPSTAIVIAEPDPSKPRKSRVVWVLSDETNLPPRKAARG